jgi:hypothetical protein
MPTFYVFNPGTCDPYEWEREKKECEARSAKDAASQMAAVWDEDGDDGRQFDVVVATKADGSDAVVFSGRCRITVEYVVDKEKPYEVEALPEEEEE